jgi:hypothetical protein
VALVYIKHAKISWHIKVCLIPTWFLEITKSAAKIKDTPVGATEMAVRSAISAASQTVPVDAPIADLVAGVATAVREAWTQRPE